MQKDLLAELHLPKLDLKNVQNIVTQNSARVASLITEHKKYVKKSYKIPPGISVIVGTNASDRPNPTPVPEENTKGVNPSFVQEKRPRPGEYCLSNGLRKSLHPPIKNNLTVTSNSLLKQNTTDNNRIKYIEIRPPVRTKCLPKPRILSVKTSVNDSESSKTIPSACIETKCLRDIIASKPVNDDGPELEVLLYKTYKKRDPSSPRVTSQQSLLKQKTTVASSTEQTAAPSNSNGVTQPETPSNGEKEPEPAFCVISEVVGNANAAFSEAEEVQVNEKETVETQLITPKKTNDITKIKGWRRKQFFVEKPTTVEFYSVPKGSQSEKNKIQLSEEKESTHLGPDNVENAFVCDSLDEFLDREADLKIGYEIPHLFAEFGIKLTSNEILSRPNLSKKDLEEVENRYCVPVSLPNDITNLDDITEEDIKRYKRAIEDDDRRPSKIPKIEERCSQTETSDSDCEIISIECEYATKNSNECESRQKNINLSDIKLLSKLIALVVYPGPFMPLHPLAQYHLDKLRSYRTKVDQRWANFAASAVLVNDKRYKRSLVPAYCCVKVDKNSAEASKEETINEKKGNKEEFRLKPCSVVIKKLDCPQVFNTWCMEHNCHNCTECGLAKGKPSSHTSQTEPGNSEKPLEKTKNQEDGGETISVSPRASFNKKIARLLSKKVRLLKANRDTLTSIDCLKNLKRDTIEFIKLKFVKESFLAGYVNIWYQKPETSSTRSRAFLTFSQTPPAANAINLRSSAVSLSHLPKVITEIVSTENIFDSNEYAILHCNGEIWEIHGSLNITFGNMSRNVEQIFTSLELPELTKLQEIAHDILQVRAVKWWVLDLTQKFKLIEFKSGNVSTVVTRKKFFEVITLNSYGFVPLSKISENRVVGAYVIQRLLPFVLIGPYYLLETRDMILKGGSSTVPFRYYGEENVTSNYPLKFFINSVIKNLEKNHRKLEGVWLYDKMCLDKTSYIEVVTSSLENPRLNSFSSIDIEHGYSLNSLTYSSPSGAASGIVRRKDGKNELQTVPVYLYFDVVELGYVEGELQFDNSVIVRHPLDGRTKMKSHKIGDWFVSIMRRRVEFFPEDLEVKWFITKHRADLGGRLPFNKFVLNGAHALTRKGVFNLFQMTEAEMEEVGFKKSENLNVLTEC